MRDGRRIALLSVGNWSANKGVLELLEAVAALPSDDVTLHLAGRDDVDAAYGRWFGPAWCAPISPVASSSTEP